MGLGFLCGLSVLRRGMFRVLWPLVLVMHLDAEPIGQAQSSEVLAALARIDQGSLAAWSFSADFLQEDSSRTVHFGPGKPAERQVRLVSVDGREPSAEELEDFSENRQEQESEDNSDFGIRDLIDEASLEFTHEDAEGAHFRFVPRFAIEGQPEPQKDLVGELVLDREDGFIRSLEVRSEGVFKPKFGIKLTKLRFGFRFQVLDDGTPAPEYVITEIKGRAYLLANFDEKVEIHYHSFGLQQPSDE